MGWLEAMSCASGTIAVCLRELLGLNLIRSEADKAHVCWIANMNILVFALVTFVVLAHDGVFIPKTSHPHIVVDGEMRLVPMPDRLASGKDDPGFPNLS